MEFRKAEIHFEDTDREPAVFEVILPIPSAQNTGMQIMLQWSVKTATLGFGSGTGYMV
jgi:hypothetical protein